MVLSRTANLLIIAIASVVILHFGASLLIPFLIAVLLWFLIRQIRQVLNKWSFLRRFFPNWLKNLISSAVVFYLIFVGAKIISENFQQILASIPKYKSNLLNLAEIIYQFSGVNLKQYLNTELSNLDLGNVFFKFMRQTSNTLSYVAIILIYTLFIFLEERDMQKKFANFFGDDEQNERLKSIMESIEVHVARYLGIKTMISIGTAFLSWLVMISIGVESALFWTFLVFTLNFIPTIGSIVATILPALFTAMQFGGFTEALILFFVVGFIQTLMGNILEPRIMGDSMNISPIVSILALSFWGALWGVVGMLLCIPLLAIMKIVFSHFESTQTIARLISEDGTLSES